MIEDVVTVYYGNKGQKIKDLDEVEIMTPEIPEHGDIISVDGSTYVVQKRIFDADSGDISVMAMLEDDFISPNAKKKAVNQPKTP